ncbi:hypothetical protein [Hydrocarboniphaga effusa]|uniref:hypothetical protein n=1 Tax=Hydrocarboniphaga effusa TaxID=243629 RepID=UPI0035B4C536
MKQPSQRGGRRANSGRKPIADSAMQRKQVMLDAETIRLAEDLGDGNLSAGLRAAVKRASSHDA